MPDETNPGDRQGLSPTPKVSAQPHRDDARVSRGQSALLRVALAADQNYFFGLLLTAASVAVTTSPRTQIEFFVLDGGISAQSWERLGALIQRLNAQAKLTRISIDEAVLRAIRGDGKKSPMTYARLLLPQSLTTGRTVYLDSDCLVLSDLTELLRADLGQSCCGAIQDPITRSLGDDTPFSAAADSNPHQPYFNAGVLLIDLDRWRQQRISEHTLDFLCRHGAHCQYWDQTALNHVLAGNWASLAHAWNFPSNRFDCRNASEVKVLHYLCNEKPWAGDPGGAAHPLWRECAAAIAGLSHWELSWMIHRDRLIRYLADEASPLLATLFRAKALAARLGGRLKPRTDENWAARYWDERHADRTHRHEARVRLRQYVYEQRRSWEEIVKVRGAQRT